MDAARLLARLDPTREFACRQIMRRLAEAGETAAAMRRFEALLALPDGTPDFGPAHAAIAALLNARHLFVPGAEGGPGQRARAEAQARRALALDPNGADPPTPMSSAPGLAFRGDAARAQGAAARCLALHPDLPPFLHGHLAGAACPAGRGDEAVEAARRADGGITDLHGWAAAALVRLGRPAEARAAAEALARTTAESWCDPGPATPEALCTWFEGAFPIRDQAASRELNAALRGLPIAGAQAAGPGGLVVGGGAEGVRHGVVEAQPDQGQLRDQDVRIVQRFGQHRRPGSPGTVVAQGEPVVRARRPVRQRSHAEPTLGHAAAGGGGAETRIGDGAGAVEAVEPQRRADRGGAARPLGVGAGRRQVMGRQLRRMGDAGGDRRFGAPDPRLPVGPDRRGAGDAVQQRDAGRVERRRDGRAGGHPGALGSGLADDATVDDAA